MRSHIKPVVNKATHPTTTIETKPTNHILLYLIISALAFILYGNTINNGYSLDDSYVTYVNPLVKKGIKAIPEIFTSNYIVMNAEEGGMHSYGYRPVTKATYAIEYELFRENPNISHFFNVLLFAITGIVLFSLLRKLLVKYHILIPFLSVVFFMVHPIHTEVVASLKNREEILSFLGALLALKYLLKWHETKRYIFILWALISFTIGYMSKVNIMTFVVVIPLVFWYFTDIKPGKMAISSLMLLAVMLLVLTIPRLILPNAVRPMQYIENPLMFDHGFMERIGTSMMALLFYLKMLVFPHPLRFYYGFDMIPIVTLANPLAILSLVLHLGMFVYAIYTFRKKSLLSFAILFYLVNISLFSNIINPPAGIVAERFLYIASLGFCIALAYGLFLLLRQNPENKSLQPKYSTYIVLIAIALSIPASAKTIDRNNDWDNEISLYEADMPHLEKSAKANFIYATNLRSKVVEQLKTGTKKNLLKSDIEKIIKHYKLAVGIYPEYPDAYNNLGESLLLLLNESDSAVKYLEKAVELNPGLTSAFFNLGYTYQITNQPEKAIENYEKALAIESWDVRTMSNLAQLYSRTGNTEKAIELNEDIIKLDPQLDVPYINLGSYALKNGDQLKAIEYFDQALRVNPNNYDLSMRLRNLFLQAGDTIRADHYLEIAKRAGPRRK